MRGLTQSNSGPALPASLIGADSSRDVQSPLVSRAIARQSFDDRSRHYFGVHPSGSEAPPTLLPQLHQTSFHSSVATLEGAIRERRGAETKSARYHIRVKSLRELPNRCSQRLQTESEEELQAPPGIFGFLARSSVMQRSTNCVRCSVIKMALVILVSLRDLAAPHFILDSMNAS